MKRIVLLSIIICYNLAVFSQATDLVVDCQTPGWLSSKINYGDQLTVKNLKVTGYINSDDLHFIGELMDNYQLHGRIDLSDVGVVGNKMDPYTNFGITNNEYTIQYLALPKSLTEVSEVMRSYKGNLSSYLKVDTLEFSPNNIKYVKASFFDNRQFESSIKHLILGEKIDSIPDDAFFDKGGVSSLKLPVGMKYIGKRAFMENYQSINDVNFNELSNLKYIGPGAFCGGYMSTTELYQPDTLIIPKSLDIRFVLFAFTYRDGQHIFMDNNIKEISGIGIGSGGKEVSGNTTAALKIHINNETPPTLISYKGLNNETKFGNSTIYVPKGAKQAYLNSDWSNATIIEVDPQTTLNISAYGNGSVSYESSAIRNQTQTFTVTEGTSATITLVPDAGHRIASVKLNGTDITSFVSNNQYTISSITANTTLEVAFETDSPIISFADANVKAICIADWDTNGDGELSEAEAAAVTDIGTVFSDNATITSFDELKYFTGLKSILSNAFKNCYYLKSISIPSSVTSIGNYAFLYCKGLTGTLIIPNSVTSIGSNPFAGCSGLANIIVEDGNQYYDSRNNCNAIIKTSTNRIISGCKNTTIPNSVTSIGFNAFANCSGLTSLDIPNSVTSIESNAFHGCSGLASVTIGNNVTNIGRNPFYGCDLLANVVVEEGNKYYDSRNNCNAIINTSTKQLVTGCMNTIIPNSVTSIGSEAFRECKGLKGSLIIPNSVTSIESSAFLDCNGLTGSLTIPNSVKSIGYQAFYRCTGIEVVKSEIEEPFSINDDVFYLSNSKHKTLQVPKGTKSKYLKFSGWTTYFNEVIEDETSITTYTLSVIASGNGSAIYDGNEVRGNTQSYTVNEGASATIIFTPDVGYRITSVKVNGADVTSSIKENQYTINNITSNTTLAVTFEAITHTLSITASGNGSATYNSTAVRGKTQEFTVNEGTSATITFVPDAGYRIASVKLNGTDVTASVANNKYVISNITANTTLAVTFEAITHTISITSSGNGSAYFNNTTIRNKTEVFTVNEGTSATVTFTSDAGYRIASVKLNGTDVTSSVANNEYTINNISANTTLIVTFEAIPPTTYTFSITATGNGTATYNSTAVRGKTQSFTVNEGISATVTFTPDAGYKIKSVKLNTTDVTASVVSNQYTISNIKSDNTLEVEFEAIIHTLNIVAVGNGNVDYNGIVIRNQSQSYSVQEGSSAVLSFTPDAGYRVGSVKVNNTDVTASVVNNSYTISNITANTTLSVTFEEIPPTRYAFTISAVGNGTVTYDGNTVRGKTSSFTVVEGTNVIVTFSADEGYRLKSVKLDNTNVTSTVVNNQYTIRNIKANTSLEVTFEAIPTYSLNITSSGNGSATYDGTAVRGKTQTFTVIEGTSATVTFAPDAGYRIASVKLNNTDVTASVANNSYTISNITSNTTLSVTFEVIPPTTYAFTISAVGNGYVAFDGNTIRSKTFSFNVVSGTNAVLTFSADEGNRLKSVKVNGQDVTSSIVGNQYTITNISANTTIAVVFEAIPTYALNIVASGNGSASYDGVIIRNQSQNFTLREGASAVVSFSEDNGYRIASVKVNNTDVTSQIVDGKITINNITQNTNVEVVFEEIPPTVYALSITASGNGSVTYDGNTVKGKASTFTIIEGSYITVQLSADDGYRLKSITLNGQDVTEDVVNNQYTTPKIMADAALIVVFEAIPTFALTIKSSAFGSVKYGDVVVTNRTETFSVREGTSATMTFTPDDNGRLHSITLNGTDISKKLINGQYTISDIRTDQSVEAEYVEDITKVTDAGVAYTVTSYDEGTVVVAAGNYGQVLTVPTSFTAKGKTWTVTDVDDDALTNATELAAIIWEPELPFTAQVSNPNLLLYVKAGKYAPSDIQNVVVGDQAENIVLTEAVSGNNFYCPKAFTAKRISYEHNYSMISGYKDCQGWETLVLPFDVSIMISAKGRELVPYSTWTYGSNLRPFWLYQMTNEGWKAADGIKANVPYIISMPNNEMYESSYNLTGNIQFIGTNVEVKVSDKLATVQYGNKRLVANYQNQAASSAIYALNVSNDWHQNTATEKEGSTFIRSLRAVHPFEAYLTVEGSNAPWAIPVFMDETTKISEKLIMNSEKFATATDRWYDLQGRKLQGEPTKNGLYINKGKKIRK